jgi:hypothetical protein
MGHICKKPNKCHTIVSASVGLILLRAPNELFGLLLRTLLIQHGQQQQRWHHYSCLTTMSMLPLLSITIPSCNPNNRGIGIITNVFKSFKNSYGMILNGMKPYFTQSIASDNYCLVDVLAYCSLLLSFTPEN